MKKILKILGCILLIVFLVVISLLVFRYFSYKDFIGKYELVDAKKESSLELNLFSWNIKSSEKIECDLWNCTGYREGFYYIKKDKIYFKFGKYNVYITKFAMKRKNEKK